MGGASPEERLLAEASSAGVVFAAMLVATVAGQLVGMAADAAMASRSFWIPIGSSVVFEGIAGARVAASRWGRPLTIRESGRVSLMYSLAWVGITAPLAVWVRLSRGPGSAVSGSLPGPMWTLAGLTLALGALVAATLLRWAVLVASAPRTR
ncbi:MAG: hypothetical protein ABSF69_06505 [Polyangiaceae bacterium]|jgi:hypothetical protein